MLLAVLLAAILPLALLASLFGPESGPSGALSAPATPPPPPTFIPTPIGNPPAPPTAVTTPTEAPSPAVTATASGTATATPTLTPTPTTSSLFSLDAARVSKVGNPGDLTGLSIVKRGSTVWLMMYYSVNTKRKITRTTSYAIVHKGSTLFSRTYQTNEKHGEQGRFSRYISYTVPRSLPWGEYSYRATLRLGSRSRTKLWTFRIGIRDKIARVSG